VLMRANSLRFLAAIAIWMFIATSVPTSASAGVPYGGCADDYGWAGRSPFYGVSSILIDGVQTRVMGNVPINIPNVATPKMVKGWRYSLAGGAGKIYEIESPGNFAPTASEYKKTLKGTMGCGATVPFYRSRFLIVDDKTGLVDMNHELVIEFALGRIALPLVHTDGVLRDLSFTTAGVTTKAIISISPREVSKVFWRSASQAYSGIPCSGIEQCTGTNDPAETKEYTLNQRYDWGDMPWITTNFRSDCFESQSATSTRKAGEDFPGILSRQGVTINLIWTASAGFEQLDKNNGGLNRPFVPVGGFGIGSNSVCGLGYAGTGIEYDPITWAKGRFDLNLIAPTNNYRGDLNPMHLSIVVPSRLLGFWGVVLNELSLTSLLDFRVNEKSTFPAIKVISDRAVFSFDNIPSESSVPYSSTLLRVIKLSKNNVTPFTLSSGSRVSLRVKSVNSSARRRISSSILPTLKITGSSKSGVTLAVSGAIKNCSYTITWKNGANIPYQVGAGTFVKKSNTIKIGLPAAARGDRGDIDLFGICTSGGKGYLRGTISL
jgi:hypothetical protein